MDEQKALKEFQERIGYQFKDEKLLYEALSHSSFANENKKARNSNERLEFLGDSVLSIVVSDHIFEHYKHMPEGELTKMRASLVCEKALFEFSKKIELGKYIFSFIPENITPDGVVFHDYKTILQEIIQKNPEERIEYHLKGESGPDHNKKFTVQVLLNTNVIGEGTGRSKKTAEQLAAKEALELMGYGAQ